MTSRPPGELRRTIRRRQQEGFVRRQQDLIGCRRNIVQPIDEEKLRERLGHIEITDEPMVAALLHLSGGVPLLAAPATREVATNPTVIDRSGAPVVSPDALC